MKSRDRFRLHGKWLQRKFAGAKEYAAEYDAGDTSAHFYNTRLRRVSESLAELSCGKVLDAGCGPNMIGDRICTKPIEYYGLDVSEEMIRACMDRYRNTPHMQYSQGRIENCPFVTAVSTSSYVLELLNMCSTRTFRWMKSSVS